MLKKGHPKRARAACNWTLVPRPPAIPELAPRLERGTRSRFDRGYRMERGPLFRETMSRRWPVYTVVSCLAVLRAPIACAQDFPTKPLRVITAEAGGAADLTGRLLAHTLSLWFGGPVVVENQASASGIVAATTVAKATPDGHTLLF